MTKVMFFYRGQRMAVCERSYNLLTGEAYADQFIGIAPAQESPLQIECHAPGTLRSVAETKDSAHKSDTAPCCC